MLDPTDPKAPQSSPTDPQPPGEAAKPTPERKAQRNDPSLDPAAAAAALAATESDILDDLQFAASALGPEAPARPRPQTSEFAALMEPFDLELALSAPHEPEVPKDAVS